MPDLGIWVGDLTFHLSTISFLLQSKFLTGQLIIIAIAKHTLPCLDSLKVS